LLLEVLLRNLLRLALDAATLGHLAVDRAGGDKRCEEVFAQLGVGHRALDVRLERVARQRGTRLGLRHAWYHLSFDSAPKYVGYDRPRAGTAVPRPPPEAPSGPARRDPRRLRLRLDRGGSRGSGSAGAKVGGA